jgi:hypothetical protein
MGNRHMRRSVNNFRILHHKSSTAAINLISVFKGASIPNSICFLIKIDYQVLYFVRERTFQVSPCEYQLENSCYWFT